MSTHTDTVGKNHHSFRKIKWLLTNPFEFFEGVKDHVDRAASIDILYEDFKKLCQEFLLKLLKEIKFL